MIIDNEAKKYLVFAYPIALLLTYENMGLPRAKIWGYLELKYGVT